MDITDPAAVREAFADQALVPPPAAPGAAFRLRSQVARFSSGPAHIRRRALAITEIDRIDPSHASRLAAERIRCGDSVRQAIIRAFHLVPDEAVNLVLQVAPSYFDPTHHAADEPLARLWPLLAPSAATSPDPVVIERLATLAPLNILHSPDVADPASLGVARISTGSPGSALDHCCSAPP